MIITFLFVDHLDIEITWSQIFQKFRKYLGKISNSDGTLVDPRSFQKGAFVEDSFRIVRNLPGRELIDLSSIRSIRVFPTLSHWQYQIFLIDQIDEIFLIDQIDQIDPNGYEMDGLYLISFQTLLDDFL